MRPEDLEQLADFRRRLEQPGFIARATSLIGSPIERAIERLPRGWQARISRATQRALEKALDLAVTTMDAQPREPSPRLHKLAAAASGAAGGAFGLPALVVELPVSTTLMLRSIADIARANGEDLADPAVRLECLNVFALGGISTSDDSTKSGYFAVRAALAKAVGEAVAYIAERTLAKESVPALARLVATIASRFQVQVSQKAAVQAVPLIGAAGGAAINVAFTDHFQDIAVAHFGIRRLERQYGEDVVRSAYLALPPP